MGEYEHMDEAEILQTLREAYDCVLRMDAQGFAERMNQTKAAIDATGDTGALLGEWLLMSAYVNTNDIDAFLSGLEQAAKHLNVRSRVIPANAGMFSEAYNVFFTVNVRPGEADANALKVAKAQELFYRMTGGGKGTALVYMAQLAYYRGEFDEARRLAIQVLNDIRDHDQPLIAMCALEVLAFVARYTSDEALWRRSMAHIKRMAAGDLGEAVGQMASVFECMLSISMGILPVLPQWLRDLDFGVIPGEWGFEATNGVICAGVFPNAIVMLVLYLLFSSKPAAALAMADIVGKVYNVSNACADAYLEFFRAGSYMLLGKTRSMDEAISRAIALIGPDGLWLIAAEFEHLSKVVYEDAAKYSPQAPECVRYLGANVLERFRLRREAELKTNFPMLSGREREVAALIMKGQTNRQIAESLRISEPTVKTHIAHICRKLNVKRRGQLAAALREGDVSLAFWVKK